MYDMLNAQPNLNSIILKNFISLYVSETILESDQVDDDDDDDASPAVAATCSGDASSAGFDLVAK